MAEGKGEASPSFGWLTVLPLLSFFISEEILRPVVHKQTDRATAALERRAVSLRHPKLTKLERLRIWLGIGAGQGVAHSCLFFLNTVITSYRGTYYNRDRCPQMSYFLVAAISSCTMFMVLSFAMVVTSVVYESGSGVTNPGTISTVKGANLKKLIPCGLHGAAVLTSFISLMEGGCIVSSILNVCLVALTIYLSFKLVSCLGKAAQ
ncbi:hypothetical protein HOP50_17g79780 [Chloropicon primus]|uniref:Uncharacterized protein n=1 Tax=Chloropicon primus TaxID=1764295 RepID=A0A5B8MXB0_9CHLO|nr:hypothetical protein A3770_17p79560 [Chloropicon primus]UPR04634.1 hypothetical protein HOP50_17g79780 [Chloropicon primus]|eukprot:QDZ25438.1 hypothetical protein A3770_17p79560 [Chloropicon primus]